MPVRVKICGITNLNDAQAAIDFGADALGFIFFPGSSRCITAEAAAAIIRTLPPFITKVGVFVDAPVDHIVRTARACSINTAQLHGNEPPGLCDEVAAAGLGVIKAFRMKGSESLAELRSYRTSAFLLDGYVPGQQGGTGEVFNWELAVQAKVFGFPIILAGGLTPANIGSAIQSVRPHAVDVSSGVEFSPGKKDLTKVRAFIEGAKSAD